MDAGFAAAASSNIYTNDLVLFEPINGGPVDCGIVLPRTSASVPADVAELICIDGTAVTKKTNEIRRLLDRSNMSPGQVVGSASNPSGQIGVVTGVATVLDLVHLDERGDPVGVLRDVSPAAVRRVRALSLGDYVVSGPWLGRVIEVSLDVDVRFDDGAVCRVAGAESKNLAAENSHHRRQMNTLFYPGKRVVGDPFSVFRGSRWLNGRWKPSREEGTVEKVEMGGVLVYWIASAHRGTDDLQASAPPVYQNPRNLTLFRSAAGCSWGGADSCFLIAGLPDRRQEGAEDKDASSSQPNDGTDGEDSDSREHGDSSSSAEGPTKTKVSLYRKQLRKFLFVGHRRKSLRERTRTPEMELSFSVYEV